MTTSRLALCADDCGLSAGVTDAIAALAAQRRLSATACLVNGSDWPRAAQLLDGLPVECGLHFNLTEGRPLSADLARHWPVLPSLPKLLAMSHLRRLPPGEALSAEWRAQVEAFVHHAGRAPAFVDGHQHVHHLPGVRRAWLADVAGWREPPAVRNTARVLGPGFGFKRAVIAHSGGGALQRALQRRGLRHNAVLLGAYGFAGDYRSRFRAWLQAAPARGGLLFCHPGAADAGDPIGAARARERAYFSSDAFVDDLAEAGVELGTAWA